MEKPYNRDTGHQGHSVHQQLEAKLLEAVERGDYREATPKFWERLVTKIPF
jgi:hypothetical protein